MLEDLSLHHKVPQVFNPPTVQSRAPERSLKNLNLDTELYDAYIETKQFLAEMRSAGYIDEDGKPMSPTQVASVMNTIKATLQDIIKMQESLYSIERVKKLESAMIEALKLAPPESQDAFLEEYEKLAK